MDSLGDQASISCGFVENSLLWVSHGTLWKTLGFTYTEEVAGSSPVPPTRETPIYGGFLLIRSVVVGSPKKSRSFDLGSEHEKIIVECKSHKWTSGGNIPSAKITVWNEAMYYFHLAPADYRKVFFILRDFSSKRNETLAEYYIRNYGHLVPDDVEFVEFDENTNTGRTIKNGI